MNKATKLHGVVYRGESYYEANLHHNNVTISLGYYPKASIASQAVTYGHQLLSDGFLPETVKERVKKLYGAYKGTRHATCYRKVRHYNDDYQASLMIQGKVHKLGVYSTKHKAELVADYATSMRKYEKNARTIKRVSNAYTMLITSVTNVQL